MGGGGGGWRPISSPHSGASLPPHTWVLGPFTASPHWTPVYSCFLPLYPDSQSSSQITFPRRRSQQDQAYYSSVISACLLHTVPIWEQSPNVVSGKPPFPHPQPPQLR